MSNQYVYFYNTTSGRITRHLEVDLTEDPTGITRNAKAGESDYTSNSTLDDALYYFPSGVLTERPSLLPTSSWNKTVGRSTGTDTITLGASLPNPSFCDIISSPEAVTNIFDQSVTTGSLSLTTTVQGTYNLVLSAFPYRDISETVIFVTGVVTYINVPKVPIVVGMKIPVIVRTTGTYISIPKTSLTINLNIPVVFASDTQLVQVPKMTSLSMAFKTPIINKTNNTTLFIPTFSLTINRLVPSVIITQHKLISINKFSLTIQTWEPIINP